MTYDLVAYQPLIICGDHPWVRVRHGPPVTSIAGPTADATTYGDRRYAMGLYRRAAAPVCCTVSTLVANAYWLGAPFDDETPNEHILYESTRLPPPSWNILRNASPGYPALNDRIGPKDDVLLLPLLSHRDPGLWDDPDVSAPNAGPSSTPTTTPATSPSAMSPCGAGGRHMVMPPAGMLLDILRAERVTVDARQTTAKVPLAGPLGVDKVRLVRHSGGRRLP